MPRSRTGQRRHRRHRIPHLDPHQRCNCLHTPQVRPVDCLRNRNRRQEWLHIHTRKWNPGHCKRHTDRIPQRSHPHRHKCHRHRHLKHNCHHTPRGHHCTGTNHPLLWLRQRSCMPNCWCTRRSRARRTPHRRLSRSRNCLRSPKGKCLRVNARTVVVASIWIVVACVDVGASQAVVAFSFDCGVGIIIARSDIGAPLTRLVFTTSIVKAHHKSHLNSCIAPGVMYSPVTSSSMLSQMPFPASPEHSPANGMQGEDVQGC